MKSKTRSETCRKINQFKRWYQPRSYLVKDENCGLLADSCRILKKIEPFS
jgi:hypothetical protein